MSAKDFIGSKIGIAIIVIAVIVVGSIGGYILLNNANQGPAEEYYALSYHWGFVIYDHNFNEVQNITVNQSTHVKIYLLSGSGLTHELHEGLEDRNMNNSLKDYNQTLVMMAMEEAEDSGLLDHGLALSDAYGSLGFIQTDVINGVVNQTSVKDLATALKAKNELPTLDFVADTKGNFDFICTNYCGEYHPDMILKNAFIVI